MVADDCVDGYFDNSGGVPAIRGDDDDYVDVDEVSYHYGSPKYLTIFMLFWYANIYNISYFHTQSPWGQSVDRLEWYVVGTIDSITNLYRDWSRKLRMKSKTLDSLLNPNVEKEMIFVSYDSQVWAKIQQ